jgi:hypothetical protein
VVGSIVVGVVLLHVLERAREPPRSQLCRVERAAVEQRIAHLDGEHGVEVEVAQRLPLVVAGEQLARALARRERCERS